jgi:TolA-binding protein
MENVEDTQGQARVNEEATPQPKTEPVKAKSPDSEDTEPTDSPRWLSKRLEQAQRASQEQMLKSLGLSSLDEAQASLAELAKMREERLTEQERNELRLKELEGQASRAKTLEETVASYAEREFSVLTEAQQAAVAAIAGADPSLRLRTIESLRPTWGPSKPTAETTAETTEAEAPKLPKSSTSSKGGPPDQGNLSPPDIRAEFEAARKTNPFRAARIARDHASELMQPKN